jgi:hypothetical protein
LLTATGSGAIGRRGVGANGTVFMADSAQADGVKWQALTKTDVGLTNVDNTADTAKPVSTAQAAADTAAKDRANHTGTQTASTIADFSTAADARITAQKAAANGLATLGSDSKILSAQLPAIALTDINTVASQAAQLALSGVGEGDVAIRTDLNQTYIHNGGTAGTMADWSVLATPTDAVLSVAGRTGAVVLTKTDVGLANVDNTADASKAVSTATQTALDLKANLASPALSGTPTAPTAAALTNTTQLATTAFVTAADAALSTTDRARANHTGTQSADTLTDGTTNKAFLATERTKLTGIATGATANSADATLLARANHTGTQLAATISDFATAAAAAAPVSSVATRTGAVVLTKTDVGLSNVDNTADASKPVSTAQAAADTVAKDRANHTGTQSADTLTDGTINKAFLATERTKLAGIATAATANSADATLLARANHTGTQTAATVSDFSTAADARIAVQKAAANGLATLGADSKILAAQLPAIALTDINSVASQAAQLALTNVGEGDVAIRTDLNQTYIHNGGVAGTMADWTLLATPTDAVLSVAGRTGAVVLTSADVGLSNVANTSDAAKPVSTATQTALDLKANLASPALSGTPSAPTAAALTSTTQLATTAFVTAADAALSTTDRARANHTGTQTASTVSDFAAAAAAAAPVSSVAARTGAVVLTKTDVGLANVDNTADAAKPVSTAQAAADTAAKDRANHTGTQSADTLTDGTTNKAFLATERTKLTGIATGATVNSADATLLARANHTGTQTASTVSDFATAADARIALQKAAANGLATLGADSKILAAQLPAIGLTDVNTVASQAAQLALANVGEGDVAIRTDLNQTYIHNGGVAGTMADWSLLATPTDAVLSVAGRTGAVVLTSADVGLSNVSNTSDAAKPVSTATQTALDLKANLASPALSGTPTAPTAAALTSTTQLATTAFVTAADTALSTADRARANHTGTQSADSLTDGTTNKAFLATERTKLTGIATAATANSADATLLARANHTGTQLAATISDFTATAAAAAPVSSVAARTGAVVLTKTDVGLANVDNTADVDKPVSTAQAAADIATADARIAAAALARGIMATPVSTNASGTPSTGITEVRDAVLGNYVFTAVAGRRYRAMLTGVRISSNVAGDLNEIRIRNGGASTPTTASTLVAAAAAYNNVVGGPGQITANAIGTFVPGAGTVTLSAFIIRSAGTGVATPVSQRELYAEDIGAL